MRRHSRHLSAITMLGLALLLGGFEVTAVLVRGLEFDQRHNLLGQLANGMASWFTPPPSPVRAGSDRMALTATLYPALVALRVVLFAALAWRANQPAACRRRKELGVQLSEDDVLRYGPVLAYGVQNERRDQVRQQTRFNVEPGMFASYQLLHNLNLHGRLLYGGGDDHRGVLANLGATLSTPLAPHHTAFLSLGADFADHAYMQSYFGLTAQQARLDRLPAYRAGGGLKSVYLSGSWNVELSNKYSLNSGVSVKRLGESAAASPLTEQRHGVMLHSALSYHF